MPEIASHEQIAAVDHVPICVDLDGTLVKSDTLVDSLLVLLRTRPLRALALPFKVLKGKAAFKAYVTESIELDVARLPYNRLLLDYLQQQHAEGRRLYLATGADRNLARRVAHHLGIFSEVLGSDGAINLTGANKLDRLRSLFGEGAFDYIGNDTPDLPLLAQSRRPMVANPSLRLRLRLRSHSIQPVRQFREARHPLHALFRATRPHQWAKNLLVLAPLLLAHTLSARSFLMALLAFFCFSLAASATYIVNDLLDIEADRHHPRKRLRPFASGDLSAFTGFAVVLVFLALALAGAVLLPAKFAGWLLLYVVSTLAYSFYLKRIALVDVLVLSGLYTLRLQAGSAATHTPISPWLAGFSIFLFFSLAIVKRFAELENLRAAGAAPKNNRGYVLADLDQLRTFGTASAYAAVVIFAIYINGDNVIHLYHKPQLLWLIVPLLILWLSRVWLLASRGLLNEDPVVFALTDRTSLLIGAAIAAVAFFAL